MDIHDKITLLSVSIVVLGWFVNNALNRRHEISKKRTEYRLEALKSFLPVLFATPRQGGNASGGLVWPRPPGGAAPLIQPATASARWLSAGGRDVR